MALFWNNLHQVRSKSKDLTPIKSLRRRKPNGLKHDYQNLQMSPMPKKQEPREQNSVETTFLLYTVYCVFFNNHSTTRKEMITLTLK
jgi:hypothetical protein